MLWLITQTNENTWDFRRNERPRKLIPFILNKDVSQKNPCWISFSFELPAELLSHGAVRSIATDHVPSTIALGFSGTGLDLDQDPFAVLMKALDSMAKEYLGVTGSLHAFQQDHFGLILWQNQD